MSRWLVGSSSSSRFGRWRTISASVRRAFSPPEKRATGDVAMSPRKSKPPRIVAQLLLARAGLEPREMPQRRFVGAQLLDLVLREIAEPQLLRGMPRSPRSGASVPASAFSSVDLPAPFGAEQADARAGEDAPVDVARAPAARRA